MNTTSHLNDDLSKKVTDTSFNILGFTWSAIEHIPATHHDIRGDVHSLASSMNLLLTYIQFHQKN